MVAKIIQIIDNQPLYDIKQDGSLDALFKVMGEIQRILDRMKPIGVKDNLRRGRSYITLKVNRAQRDSIRSQTTHSKGTAYDITKYQTFLTKYGMVCPF